MNTRKTILIVLIIIACVLGILFSLYYQGISHIETGNDYESIENLMFFVSKPHTCAWARGLGKSYLDDLRKSLIKFETTVALMKYQNREDIKFFKTYKLSRKWYKEECIEKKQEYGRLLDRISQNLLDKNWEHVYMEGYFQGYNTDYSYSIYICEKELLVIATHFY